MQAAFIYGVKAMSYSRSEMQQKGFVPLEIGNFPVQPDALAKLLRMDSTYSVTTIGQEMFVARNRIASENLLHTTLYKQRLQRRKPLSKAALARYYRSEHRVRSDDSVLMTAETAIRLLGRVDSLSARNWERISKALGLSDSETFLSILNDHVIPKLGDLAPDTTLVIRASTTGAYMPISIARWCFAAGHLGRDFLEPLQNLPEPLHDWQQLAPEEMLQGLTTWSSLISFPRPLSLSTGRFGLLLSIQGDSLPEIMPTKFPVSWMELFRQPCDFASQSHPRAIFTEPLNSRLLGHRRHLWHGPWNDGDKLIDWCIGQGVALIAKLCDFIFHAECSGSGSVDGKQLTRPFPALLTFDRIVKQTLAVQAAESRSHQKLRVFEIADLWSDLIAFIRGSPPKKDFYSLWMSPSAAFTSASEFAIDWPAAWADRLLENTRIVYEELYNVIGKSVWASRRFWKSDEGFSVEVESGKREDGSIFVSRLLRELRNTHHGYVGERDNKFSRLALTTGDTPDSMSFLPTVWLLCCLARPKHFFQVNAP